MLLTHDLDFGELMAASGMKLPTVVIFRLRDMRPERVSAYLGEIVSQYEAALEQGVIGPLPKQLNLCIMSAPGCCEVER